MTPFLFNGDVLVFDVTIWKMGIIVSLARSLGIRYNTGKSKTEKGKNSGLQVIRLNRYKKQLSKQMSMICQSVYAIA